MGVLGANFYKQKESFFFALTFEKKNLGLFARSGKSASDPFLNSNNNLVANAQDLETVMHLFRVCCYLVLGSVAIHILPSGR